MAKVILYTLFQNNLKTFLEFRKEYDATIEFNRIVVTPEKNSLPIGGIIEDIKAFKFKDPNGVKVNYKIYFDTSLHTHSIEPLYAYLGPLEKLSILFHFRKLWIQQLWFSNLVVSILAIILALVNIFKK